MEDVIARRHLDERLIIAQVELFQADGAFWRLPQEARRQDLRHSHLLAGSEVQLCVMRAPVVLELNNWRDVPDVPEARRPRNWHAALLILL
jgi:hypothetical protein